LGTVSSPKIHQPWYLCGGCKHELPFGDIHASVFAGPLVDLSEPKLVHPTDVGGSETMVDRHFID